ncbi:metallodependent hydrolase [Escherichia coli]|uniref:Metallodependent hydrolase n=1 Tax=Escherichia coli TaxID=562 RepID=A0A2X1MZ39_ECOLX|nr:metallodependent hydrolase [Escherichia coli]
MAYYTVLQRTEKTAGKLLDLGFYISFSGIVTFRNAEQLRDAARYVPLDRFTGGN